MSTMIATKRVYPIGYSTLGSQERIDELMSNPQTLLIDTRYKPYSSWNEEFCKEALQAKYGERYKWAGEYLGNTNHASKGGPIKLAKPQKGIAGLISYLNKGYDLILLCQCRDHAKCHRSEIIRLLTQQVHVDVVFQQPQPQEGVLAAKTDAEEAIAIEPPDLAPNDNAENDKANQKYCIVCHEAATLFSKSGRPEGMYCKKHGHCLRCGSSIEQFVKYPYGELHVCPCVLAYYEQTMLIEEMKHCLPMAFSF